MFLAAADYHRGRAAGMAGVTRQQFHRYVRTYRIKSPPLALNVKLDANDKRLIGALLDAGMPLRQVTKKFEVNRNVIRRRAKC